MNEIKTYNYYIYIMASKRNGTGITSGLLKRVQEHKEGVKKRFTKKYDVKLLVHYEYFTQIESAIAREKTIKKLE